LYVRKSLKRKRNAPVLPTVSEPVPVAVNARPVDITFLAKSIARHDKRKRKSGDTSTDDNEYGFEVVPSPLLPDEEEDRSTENVQKQCIQMLLEKSKAWEDEGKPCDFVDYIFIQVEEDPPSPLRKKKSDLPTLNNLGKVLNGEKIADHIRKLTEGSHQWGAEARKLAIKLALLEFSKVTDENNPTSKKASLNAVCATVAQDILGIDFPNLTLWVREYLALGTISEPAKRYRAPPLSTPRQITPEYILEILEFCAVQLKNGLIVNSTTIQNHLKGDSRLHYLITTAICPPMEIPIPVI
jgi:hypothetical protein